MLKKDPIIEEVRKTRDNLASKSHYNLDLIIKDAQKRQNQSKSKIVRFHRKPV